MTNSLRALLDVLAGEWSTTLALLALVFARIAPLVALAPLFALRAAPIFVRTAAAGALAIALAPVASAHAAAPPAAVMLPMALVLEVVRGGLFALVAALPVFAIGWAGRFVDVTRGSANAEEAAPLLDRRGTPLQTFFTLFAVALFFALDGHGYVLEAFGETLTIAPIGGPLATNDESLVEGPIRLIASALSLAVAIAAPAIVAMLVAEISLGLLGRTAPQIPIYFVGMPLRSAAGVAAAFVTLALLAPRLPEIFGDYAGAISP